MDYGNFVFCASCGSRFPAGNSFCPVCGAQIVQPQSPVYPNNGAAYNTAPAYNPAPAYGTYPTAQPSSASSATGAIGLACGILSLLVLIIGASADISAIAGSSFFFAIAGVVLGPVSMSQAKKSGKSSGMGVAALVLSIIALVIWVIALVIGIALISQYASYSHTYHDFGY